MARIIEVHITPMKPCIKTICCCPEDFHSICQAAYQLTTKTGLVLRALIRPNCTNQVVLSIDVDFLHSIKSISTRIHASFINILIVFMSASSTDIGHRMIIISAITILIVLILVFISSTFISALNTRLARNIPTYGNIIIRRECLYRNPRRFPHFLHINQPPREPVFQGFPS